MKKILLLLCLFLILSCRKENEAIYQFFPKQSVFKAGYANKYYNHYLPYDSNEESKTRISYASYQLLPDDVIEIRNYNAGFEIRGWQYYHINQGGLHLDSAWYLSGSDTLQARIEAGIMKNFVDTGSTFYRENYDYQNQVHQYISHQYQKRDTAIDGKNGLQFLYNRSYRNLETDSTLQNWMAKEVYLEGLGFWSSWEQSTNGYYTTELVEQMPLSKFQKLANHHEKRVAYIDPEAAWKSSPNFKLCGRESQIADYYNGEPDAGYGEGKKELARLIHDNSKQAELGSFEGLLTFRFVISCEGSVGRFIAEAYDFDYQEIEVPQDLAQHYIDLFCSLKSWRATVINEEARDAYAYITLKIKDEKIIDILP